LAISEGTRPNGVRDIADSSHPGSTPSEPAIQDRSPSRHPKKARRKERGSRIFREQ
jgi:hypothetical protein